MSSMTKLITTVHWSVPQQFKDHIDQNKDLHCLVFGGGKQRLDGLNDKWLSDNCIPDDARPNNISKLNPFLNEMTSIYLIHKNLGLLDGHTANIGHVHYRRFFNKNDIEDIDTCDGIIVNPVALGVVGFKCTLEKQYELCHVAEDFQILKSLVIKEGLYDEEVWSKWTHLDYLYAPCNIFCLKRECFNIYANDMFKVVLQLPVLIDVSTRDDYQRRACSFLSERLTSYWFFKQSYRKTMRFIEKPCQFHPEWKATNSFDVRGQYNGVRKGDESLKKIEAWLKSRK